MDEIKISNGTCMKTSETAGALLHISALDNQRLISK